MLSSEFCKLRITAILNARLTTTELGSNQTFGMGQDIFWPRKLVGRPIQIVRASEPAVPQDQTSGTQPKISTDETLEQQDHVFNYGLQLVQMGLFFMQLDDSEHEGDGERMMRNWKMLMLYARCSGHSKKYAFEAMRLLSYCRALFSEKMAHCAIHGQFVNPSGGKGKTMLTI